MRDAGILDSLFQKMFVGSGVAGWERGVEIGPGSGKYTLRVLANSQSHVMAADISAGYQDHFKSRIGEAGLSARVTPILLHSDSATLHRAIQAKGWKGSLDAVYSIDAMAHVDLQYLIAYLVTAAACLRTGGKLVMTLANCCSDAGFDKLISDTKRIFSRLGTHRAKFEWMSPDAVKSILPRLGFSIDMLDTNGRDILVVATLLRPLTDEKLLKSIESSQTS
ncbi:MAG: SAM-dependent methyltransferase [Hyphomicrobiales bacterium]